MFFEGAIKFKGAKLIWKSWAPPRTKFFMYLVMHLCTWTSERRKHHGLQEDDTCALCHEEPETVERLLLHCPTARAIWWNVQRGVNLESRYQATTMDIFDTWKKMRVGLDKTPRKGLDSIFMLTMWCIWKERNNRVFQEQAATVTQITERLSEEARLWVLAGAKHLGSLMMRE